MEVTQLQIMQATAALVSSCLGATALLYSMFAYTRSLKISHYNELDKTYATLLSMAFQNPYLIKPDTITNKEQQEKYDIYAFMVWNFLEAIYDKCLNDNVLAETWMPIVEVEGKLHSVWFLRDENKDKFKKKFYDYIKAMLVPGEANTHAVSS